MVDYDVFHRGAVGEGLVDDGLEPDFAAPTIRPVLGDHGGALGVVDAVDEGVGGEASEDDGVDRTDAGAGEQGDGELGRHSHVDGDPVTLPDAEAFEDVGELLHFDVEFGEGKLADFAGLALPQDGGLVRLVAQGVAVDAVVAEVDLAADKPLRPGQVPFEDLGPGREPVQLLRDRTPEGFGIVDGLFVEGLVFLKGLDVRFRGEIRRRGEDAVLAEDGFEVRIQGGGGRRHAVLFSWWRRGWGPHRTNLSSRKQ